MQIPKHSEIVIIGGGPGGAMAASWLRLAGHEVTVLEKEQFPRPMVGESLIPHFWRFMEEIGMVEKMQKEGFIVKNGGVVNWEGQMRSVRLKDFGFKLPALHIERDIFDELMLDRARELGAQVFERCKVKSARFGHTATVTYEDLANNREGEITCDYLIDASGQTALISRQEGLRVMDDDFKFQSFWGYYTRSSYFDVNGTVHKFESRFDHPPATFIEGLDNWGWAWHILQRETVSIGYILPRNMMAKFKEGGDSIEERFKAMKRFSPVLTEWLDNDTFIPGSVSSIKDYAYEPASLSYNNCYLIGDAAAFVDPVNSNGIIMALFSGYLAAWCVDKSIRSPQRSQFYKDLYQKKLGERVALFKMIAVPAETLTEDQLAHGRKMFAEMSDNEVYLLLTQTTMTGRAKNVDLLLGERGLKFKQMWADLEQYAAS